MNSRGMKKLDHYVRKQLDNALANRYADKEYMEYLACEEEMGDELLDEYRNVERVIAHQLSREKNTAGEKLVEYYIKWSCLPYSECTWEDEGLIKQKYGKKIDQYYERINSKTLPNKTNSVRYFFSSTNCKDSVPLFDNNCRRRNTIIAIYEADLLFFKWR